MVISHVLSLGVEIKEYTKKHTRRKRDTEFGNTLQIFPDDKGQLLVFPDNLTVYDLAQENQKLKNKFDILKSNTTSLQKSVEKSASHLRSTIKDHDNNTPRPFPWPWPSALQKSIHIPADLLTFLCAIFTGEMQLKYPSKCLFS